MMIAPTEVRKSVVVVVRLPPSLGVQFPSKDEDDSPPHITLWFQGELPERDVDSFIDAVRSAVERVGQFTGRLTGNIEYFQHPDKRIAYAEVMPLSEFNMLFLAIQGELMMRGIFSDSEYYGDSWDYQPHATVAYLPVDGLWFGPCPTGDFRVSQLEIWGAGLDIPIDIDQVHEPMMKSWIRAHTRHAPISGALVPVVAHQDSRTKKQAPPPAPRRPAAAQQQQSSSKPKNPETSIDSRMKDIQERVPKFAAAVRSIDTIKDPEGKFKIGRGMYSPKQASQAMRRQQAADAIRYHQARVDRADLVKSPGSLKAQQLKQSVQKISDHINSRGGLPNAELTNGKMHAKLRLEGDSVKADMFDEHGIAHTHTFKSAAAAILSLAQRGYHRGSDGAMEKLQGTVKWLYGNRAAEAVKNAEQLRAQGKEFGANEIERQFLRANGVNEDEMVAKDEIRQRVADLLNPEKAARLDPDDASEVARILKKQKPKSFGAHEKKVERLATEELLSPEETKEAITMQISQDQGRRELAKAEEKFRKIVNGSDSARLTKRNINKTADRYLAQVERELSDRGHELGTFDPEPFKFYVQQIIEDKGRKFASQTFGKDIVDYLSINVKNASDAEEKAKIKAKIGHDPFDTEFIKNTIKLHGRYVTSIKGTNPSTEDMSLPVTLIDRDGNDFEFPKFKDDRIQNRHLDQYWAGAAVGELQRSVDERQKHLDNWKNGFDDLVDASRKIAALRYQLRDPDFHDSANGQLARDLLDHMSRKREEMWGIKTPASKHGEFGDLNPTAAEEREPEPQHKPEIPVKSAAKKKKRSEKFEQEEVPF